MPRKKNGSENTSIYIGKVSAGEAAAHFTVCSDNGSGFYGLWKTTAVNWYLNERIKKDHGV